MISPRTLLPLLSLWTPLILVATASAGLPKPLQATARVEQPTVQVGEPVRLLIRVKNSEGMPEIEVPRADGVTISASGETQTMPSILQGIRPLSNGHVPGQHIVESLRELSKQLATDPTGMQSIPDPQLMQQYQGMLKRGLGNIKNGDYTVVYLATPEKTGMLTIPPLTVRSGGQTVRTQPINLTVTEPRPSPWVRAALSLSNPKPFVGDTVNLYVDLLVRRWPEQVGHTKTKWKSQPINHVTLNIPTLAGLPQVQPLQSLEQLVSKRRLPPGQLGYHINNYPGVILLEQEPPPSPANTLDPQWYRRRLSLAFRARRVGKVEVPPLRVAGQVYVPSGRKNEYKWEGFVAVSSPLTFNVLDPADRPSDYNGTVGPCRLIASASRTTMPAGTPFVLTLREEGHGNLSRATAPNLEAIPAFRDHFVIHAETDVLHSEKVHEFTWTLRPRSEVVTEVPAITLSWFNPRTEKFEQAHSDPIALQVTPAPARPDPVPPVAANTPPAPDAPSAEPDNQLVRRTFPRELFFGAGLAAFLVVVAVLVGVRRRRLTPGQRVRQSQRRQRIEQARQRLRAPSLTASEVSAAVQDFLRARLDLPPGEITPDEAAEHLTHAGYSWELSERCADILRTCAALCFAPGQSPSAAGNLATDAEGVLHALSAAQPRRARTTASHEDELTRQRQAALAENYPSK